MTHRYTITTGFRCVAVARTNTVKFYSGMDFERDRPCLKLPSTKYNWVSRWIHIHWKLTVLDKSQSIIGQHGISNDADHQPILCMQFHSIYEDFMYRTYTAYNNSAHRTKEYRAWSTYVKYSNKTLKCYKTRL